MFLIARTDALEPEGIDNALQRAERYLKAGADGIYIEAPNSEKQLGQIGKKFRGTPQMTNMFEGDDETPWLTPKELHQLGFSMILYPTTLLFQVVKTLQGALDRYCTQAYRRELLCRGVVARRKIAGRELYGQRTRR